MPADVRPAADNGRAFIDSNVICYLFGSDPAKAARAREVLGDHAVISVQVLAEVSNVASRKAKMTWQEIEEVIELISGVCKVEPLTIAIHSRARQIAARTGYTIYDAQVIAAAMSSGCSLIWSEDMQHGHALTEFNSTLTIRNPFADAG